MKNNNYEAARANLDTALTQDTTVTGKTRGEAFKMQAQVLRELADSTMLPDEYKDLYRRARIAGDSAIAYDPGLREEVQTKRGLAFTSQFQKGAKSFQKAQRTADSTAFQRAASYFGGASATFPDSSEAILNEAYSYLNMQRMMQSGSMSEAIPRLERYMETADQPDKNAYDILSALYLQNEQTKKAIDLLESARKDLSSRQTYFRIAGSPGLEYSGTVETDGNAQEVSGSVPDEVSVESEGTVSGTFQKNQKKGQLQIQLFYRGASIQDTTLRSGAGGSVSLSADLSTETPLAELEGRLLNAYNQAGMTQTAMEEYRAQIEKNPNNVTYRYNYGSMLLNADRYDEAIEQLKKAVDLDSGNVRAQYNLGAAYTNKARQVQDSLRSIQDSIDAIRDVVVEENRQQTDEEERIVNELSRKQKVVAQKQLNLYKKAIPPLERARQLADRGGDSVRENACRALLTAYVQTEQIKKAEKVEDCAETQLQQEGGQEGGN